VVLSISCIVSAFRGIGISDATLQRPENQQYPEQALYWFFLAEVGYCVTIIPVKLSISYMLVRVAHGRKAYVWSQYAAMAIFTIMNLIACFYVIFRCWPVSAAWDFSLLGPDGQGKCLDTATLTTVYYVATAINIATDWFTALMPIPLLWNVNLNLNSKISVVSILSLGIL
jgi:hypothetical protein